ncbi:MAG: hypothetical protein KGI91_03905 [Burkholderiales bacterium]|nr:hypothetical protein [Burkholderiales bacterium]MDE2076205.1 hypothetical protein [Burkholderiales bacterium]MDE2431365.1 hypothetical protein [Burkholderiales bacterium]
MTQQINLLDESLLQGRDWAHGGMVLSVILAASVAAAAHGVYEKWKWQQASQQVAAIEADKEARAQALQQVVDQIGQLKAQLDADEQMRKAAAAMIDPPQHSVARFEQLVGALSNSMWMQSVEFSGAKGVHLVVSGLHQADLARYADGLSGSEAFAGLPIEILQVERKTLSAQDSDGAAPAKAPPVPYYVFELAGVDELTPLETTP